MKKYRVTEKHPEIKEDIIFERQRDMYLSPSNFIHMPDEDIEILLVKGWIEEIKEVVYNTAWVEKMKLFDDILSKYHIEDLETLKKILEHENKS